MNSRTIIVPLDSSYREYQKFEDAFKDSDLWERFLFVCDSDIQVNPEQARVVQIDPIKYKLEDFENAYKAVVPDNNFNDFCSVDLLQNRNKYSDSKAYLDSLKLSFLSLIDILNKYDDAVLVYNSALHFFPRAVTRIARHLGFEVHSYTQSIIPDKEFIWIDNAETYRCEVLQKRFNYYLNNSKALDDRYSSLKNRVIAGKKNKTFLSDKRTFIYELRSFYAFRNRIFTWKLFTWRRVLGFGEKFIFRRFRAFFWRRAVSSKIPEEFIFFPLGNPLESTTIIRSYPFHHEVEVLYKLSRELDDDITILIKEHPGYEGWFDLANLEKIKMMPNVRLVKSDISSHELIRKCSAVVTLNSSLFFESFFFDKPCVIFGRGLFSGYEVVSEANSIEACKQLFTKLRSEGFKISASQAIKRKAFAVAYEDVSYDGKIYKNDKSARNALSRMLQTKLEKI